MKGLRTPRFRRRPLGTALVALALIPPLAGCTKAVRQDVPPGAVSARVPEKDERIVAATTKTGRLFEFEDAGGQIRGDSLYGVVDGTSIRLATADVDHIVLEHREGDAVKSLLLGVGIVTVVLGGLAAYYYATKESCPFVYAWDGERYVFDAEPYGGAIARGLERDDFSPLDHLVPDGGVYRLRVTNEVNETQHTNFLELWAVDHAPGARLAANADGRLFDVRGRKAPLAAVDATGGDLLPWLASTDRLVWEPEAGPGPDGTLRESIELTFPRPPGATEARLVVNAATSLWGSHMIREFVQLRGAEGAAAWATRLESDPRAVPELYDWIRRDGLYVLEIQVLEPTGWETRGLLRGEGPFLAHDRVVTLDVSRAAGDDLRIRIQPARGFWALNSFGIDYGAEGPLDPIRLALRSARAPDGADLLPRLAAVDDAYLDMPRIGDRADLAFPAPPVAPGRERTVFLRTHGWYEIRLDPSAPADPALARRIEEEPGLGARYSAERRERWSPADAVARAREMIGAGG